MTIHHVLEGTTEKNPCVVVELSGGKPVAVQFNQRGSELQQEKLKVHEWLSPITEGDVQIVKWDQIFPHSEPLKLIMMIDSFRGWERKQGIMFNQKLEGDVSNVSAVVIGCSGCGLTKSLQISSTARGECKILAKYTRDPVLRDRRDILDVYELISDRGLTPLVAWGSFHFFDFMKDI